MFAYKTLVEMLPEYGVPIGEAEYIEDLFRKFDAHCELGVPVPTINGMTFQRPGFFNEMRLLQCLRDNEPLIIKREVAFWVDATRPV